MKRKLSSGGRLTLRVLIGLVVFISLFIAVFSQEGTYFYCPYSENYYINEQVIEDSGLLEGKIQKIQDKQPGFRRSCRNLKAAFWVVDKQPTPSIVKIGTKKFKDPELFQTALNAGVRNLTEQEPVSMYYVEKYTEQWVGGQYDDYKKAITFKKGSPVNTLVHEYLHYVWYRDKLDQDIKLVGELTTFYKNSHDLQFRMKDYTSDMTKPTEFFSYGCTEFANRHLTPYILQKCDQYIDRSKLRMFYQ